MNEYPRDRAKFVRWVLRGSGCCHSTLIVFIDLAERSDEEGRSWPSVETIAFDTRLSLRSVKLALKELREGGWLTRRSHGSNVGTNFYQIDLLKLYKAYQAKDRERAQHYLNRNQVTALVSEEDAPEEPQTACEKPVEPCVEPTKTVEKPKTAVENTVLTIKVERRLSAVSAPRMGRNLHLNPQEPPGTTKAKTTAEAKAYDGGKAKSFQVIVKPRKPP